jgi:hypothetical protein
MRPKSIFADPGCLSWIRIFSCRILDPRSRVKKMFLSSRKNDLGCSSRIRIFFPSRICDPDPGFRGQKRTGSRIQIRNIA